MDIQKNIKYWLQSAEIDLQTAENIFSTGRDFHFCLFVAHLVLEKTLKALVVKVTNDHPPKIHNLSHLAELADLDLTTDQVNFLQEVNQFSIQTRYPDEQFEFYKRCNEEFAEKYLNKIKDFRQWLFTMIEKLL